MKVVLPISILFAITGFFFLVCSFSDHLSNTSDFIKSDSSQYKVYKIDSINSYYVIYAKQGDRIFKIISKKMDDKNNRIVVGEIYKLKLHSMLTVNGQSIIPSNQIYEMSGWRIDDSTTISFEGDSIRDLFYADNLRGLALKKK